MNTTTKTKKLTGPQLRVLRGIEIHGYRMVRDKVSAEILLAAGLVSYNMNPRGEERSWTVTDAGRALLG
jgi:hypothetical protein